MADNKFVHFRIEILFHCFLYHIAAYFIPYSSIFWRLKILRILWNFTEPWKCLSLKFCSWLVQLHDYHLLILKKFVYKTIHLYRVTIYYVFMWNVKGKSLVVFANHDSLFGIYLASHMEICGCNNLEGCKHHAQLSTTLWQPYKFVARYIIQMGRLEQWEWSFLLKEHNH